MTANESYGLTTLTSLTSLTALNYLTSLTALNLRKLNGVMKAFALQFQEPDFPVDASAISRHGSIGSYHAVAWYDEGDGVVAHRTADGLG